MMLTLGMKNVLVIVNLLGKVWGKGWVGVSQQGGAALALGCCGSIRVRHASGGAVGPGREKQVSAPKAGGCFAKIVRPLRLGKAGGSGHPLTPVKWA